MEVLIIASQKYGTPAKIIIERRDDWRWYGFLPDQGNQSVSVNAKHIAYLGDQPVVHDNHIHHERGY